MAVRGGARRVVGADAGGWVGGLGAGTWWAVVDDGMRRVAAGVSARGLDEGT